jgi:HlyD family secretion protein
MELGVRATAQLVVLPDERNLASLAVGQRAVASADAFPERSFPARVSYISPAVDATQGTIEVRLAMDSVPPYLRPDMTVSVEIEVARVDRALVIPLDAVRDPQSPDAWVLVRRDGRARRQPVRLGARGDRFVQVLEGLREGEIVLQPGLRRLEPGSRVRVRLPIE